MKNCEIIYFQIHDVGRSIDLSHTVEILPGYRDKKKFKSREVPKSISLPETILIELVKYVEPIPIFIIDDPKINYESLTSSDVVPYTRIFASQITLEVNIYGEGVISLITRIKFNEIGQSDLHHFQDYVFQLPKVPIHLLSPVYNQNLDEYYTVDRWVSLQFTLLYEKIHPFITKQLYKYMSQEPETYTIYCISDPGIEPRKFVQENKLFFATLLAGEPKSTSLHEMQIEMILKNTFSYLSNDMVIFDSENCLIIQPDEVYEDLILTIELANYQLLELRTLDNILDHWLEEAEEETNRLYRHNIGSWKGIGKNLRKLSNLQVDALFVLENIENVSKIIGDYYLGQMYTHLCKLFHVEHWSTSIKNRMNVLENLYNMAKEKVNNRNMFIMEFILGVFFLIDVVFLFL